MKQNVLFLILTISILWYPAAAQTWTGNTNTDWGTNTNWNPMTVPAPSGVVTIPNTPTKPVILNGTIAVVKSVKVENGGQLTINAGGSLSIDGSSGLGLHNQGTVNNNGNLTIGAAIGTGGINLQNEGTFNNNGGEIKLDRSPSMGIYNVGGTFNNAAKITIGATASTGDNGLYNLGTFTNNTGGEINIDRVPLYSLNNQSAFFNYAKINIGGTVSGGLFGIFANANFTNGSGGDLRIDRVPYIGIFSSGGNFTNSAKISIGGVGTGGSFGIRNQTTFLNDANGEINIDRTADTGLSQFLGSFTNLGKITIGAVASVTGYGLNSQATFNNTGGEIKIDQTTDGGLWNFNGTFTNTGKISIGANASVGNNGLFNYIGAVFHNNPGGEINIDRSNVNGLQNFGGTFNNKAKIVIGAASISGLGLYNTFSGTFNNQACASLTTFGPFTNFATFNNFGLFTVNTPGAHSNLGFTNNGILSYPQGNPIPLVTNNDFIVVPISGGAVIPNALQKGAVLSFTIGATWYLDPALTLPAGAYNQAANTFTPAASLPQCAANTVYFSATDNANGNCTLVTSIRVTYDAVPPSISCPLNILRNTDLNQCSATVNYATPTASDNCTLASVLPLAPSLPSGSVFQKGATNVTWQATDATGQTARCTFTITVTDGQAPAISCPLNITKSTDPGQCAATVTYANPTATDNCTPAPTLMWVSGGTMPVPSGNNSTSTFLKGATIVTWKATDAAGLTKTCTFRVTVNDNELPTISCPGSQSVNTTSNACSSAVVSYALPTASDNCGPTPTVARVSGPASGSTFPKGITNVVWRATDASANIKTCSFSVTVTDNTPPAITCPPSMAITAAPGQCSAGATYANPTATDNCAIASVILTNGLASGSIFPQGATVNTWRAMDESGVTSTCTFTVTVSCGTGNEQAAERSEKLTVKSEKLAARTTDDGALIAMHLTPNPASTEVQVRIENLGETGGDLTVLDAQGRWILRQKVAAGQNQVALMSDRWSAGVYMVVLQADGKRTVQRLVVQH